MQEKIENFKNMSLKEQKEILLLIISKSKNKSEGFKKLYNTIVGIDISKNLKILSKEFVKIYIFLMEAVEYVNSKKLKESFDNLDKIQKVLSDLKTEEKNEIELEDLDKILEEKMSDL